MAPKFESQSCAYCQAPIKAQIVDGNIHGRWGYFCVGCFKSLGGKFGVGRGQRFDMATGKKLEG